MKDPKVGSLPDENFTDFTLIIKIDIQSIHWVVAQWDSPTVTAKFECVQILAKQGKHKQPF